MDGGLHGNLCSLTDALTTRSGNAVGDLRDNKGRVVGNDEFVSVAIGQIALLNQVYEELIALKTLNDESGQSLFKNFKQLSGGATQGLIVDNGRAAISCD